MSIQSDINSALGQIGIMASLNPELQEAAKERGELRKLDKAEDVWKKQQEIVSGELDKVAKSEAEAIESGNNLSVVNPYQEERDKVTGELRDLAEKRTQTAKQRFDIAPSEETYKRYSDAKGSFDYFNREVGKPYTPPEQYSIRKAEEAKDRAGRAALAKAELRQQRGEIYRREFLKRGGDLYESGYFKNTPWPDTKEDIEKRVRKRGGDLYESGYFKNTPWPDTREDIKKRGGDLYEKQERKK